MYRFVAASFIGRTQLREAIPVRGRDTAYRLYRGHPYDV